MAHLFGLARIGRDAELRTTPQGDRVINLSLAFSYGRKVVEGKRATQWVEGTLWNKQAEALAEYLLKGTQVSVMIEDIHIATFTKSDGIEAAKLTGRISSLDFAGTPAAASPPPPPPRPPSPRPPPPPRAAAPGGSGFDDMDDDIPF